MSDVRYGSTAATAGGSPVEGEAALRLRFKTILILRVAFVIAVLLLAGVGFLINVQRQGDMPDASGFSVVVIVFAVVSIASAVAAIFLVPLIVPLNRPMATFPDPTLAPGAAPPLDTGVAGRLFTRSILSGALTESIGLLGFVLLILGVSTQTYLFFLALSLVGSAVTWPRWSQWEQAYIDDASNVVVG